MKQLFRIVACGVLAALLLSGVMLLTACQQQTQNEGAQNGQTPNVQTPSNGNPTVELPSREIVIATMVTEDILPLWVAEAEGSFEALGLDARIETFQSAQELTAAFTSGDVDFAMTDPVVSATLTAGKIPVTMLWVTLGATAEQGRFGIMTTPETGITTLADLAGQPIGTGENTMLEYVMDKLLLGAGVEEDQIIAEQIPKIPVRFEMMRSGQVAAAVLPGTLLALGEQTGLVLVADDTKGENLSQSVLVTRTEYATTDEGQAVIEVIRTAWNGSADMINADPEAYRALLVEKASLPELIKDSYPISTYPQAALPTAAMIDPILAWMDHKGYLIVPVSFDPATGALQAD